LNRQRGIAVIALKNAARRRMNTSTVARKRPFQPFPQAPKNVWPCGFRFIRPRCIVLSYIRGSSLICFVL